jgi:DNA-binding response OmpR family regulator
MLVLVVDDEAGVRHSIERSIAAQGWRAISVESVSEALFQAANEVFDAMVVDLHLPGMSGAELLKRLDPYHKDHVVFITGGPADKAEAKFLRRQRVLYKPFTDDDLKGAIEEAAAA